MSNQNLEVALKIAAQTSGQKDIGLLVDELKNIGTSSTSTEKQASELAKELEQLAKQQALITSFQQSTLALEKQELATIAAANGLQKLEKEAKDTDKPFVDLARSISAAEDDLQRMRKELTQQTSKHKVLQTELKKTGVNTENLAAKKRELAASFTRVGKNVDSYTAKLKQGSAAERAHGQSLGNITGRIVALTAGYVGLNQVSSALTDIFTAGDKFERLGIQMDALMGSIAGGEQATAWVKEFTKTTPLQLENTSQAFVKLKAFGLDPMDGTLQAITDSAFRLGGGFQEVEGISLALGQAWAKQKLQGEEINQLVERGIPVWGLLEKATGKSTEELQKMSSAGLLGRDTIKSLIDEMGKESVGAAAANMTLLSGQFSNAKDNLVNFYDLIASSGAMDYLKTQLTLLNTTFDEMAKDGRLQEWAQNISDTIVATGEAVKSTFTTIYEYRDEIALVAKAYLALKVGSYFTNVALGAKSAITSLVSYRAGIAATTAATKAANSATLAWGNTLKTALKGAGVAVALDFTIGQFTRVYDATTGLLKANADLSVSQSFLDNQTTKMAEKLKILSTQTGINITSADQFFKLVDNGTLVFDELTKKYINVEEQQRKLAQATKDAAAEEKQRQELTTLTLKQAVDTTLSLEKQAESLNGVRGGVQGFITAIDSAKATLSGAGEEYSQQVVLLDQLKAKYEAHNESLERQAFLAGDLNAAYKVLGIESAAALQELAEQQQGAFELIQQSEEPLELQRQAYLKWAESALKAAEATGETIPQSVEAAAATLGLTEELEKLIETQSVLTPALEDNSDAVNKFKAALDETKQAIEQNEAVIKSSTASAQSKAEAQKALTIQQQRLEEETQDLIRVQELENSTLKQLQREQSLLTDEMDNLNRRYQSGAIDASQYNDEKERLNDLLTVANNLLGDFSNAQDTATRSTVSNTNALRDSTAAASESVSARKSLVSIVEEEIEAVGRLQSAWDSADSANTSTNYSTTSFNESGDRTYETATAATIVAFEDENNIAQELRNTTTAVLDYRRELSRTENNANRETYFNETLAAINAAAGNNSELERLEGVLEQSLNSVFSTLADSQAQQLIKLIAELKADTKTSPTSSGEVSTASLSSSTASGEVSTASIEKLVTTMETLANSIANQSTATVAATPKQTVRIEWVQNGETFKADLLAEFEDKFLTTLESANGVGAIFTG